MIRKHAHAFLLFFIAMGLFVSLWSLKNHYAKTGASACDVSRTFNCDVVNKGIYSEIGGFPVAGIGVIGYLVLGVIAVFYGKEKDPTLAKILVAFSILGLIFSLYLTYVEAFVLATYCLLCLASLSSIMGASLTGYSLYRRNDASV